MTETTDFIRRLPKAELHVHLEGSIEPEDLFAFAARNGAVLPWVSEDELRAAYSFTSLDDFLVLLWAGCRVLRTRQDFYDVTRNYLRRAAAQGVRRAEMSFAPQNFLPRGIRIDDQLGGIADAITDARTDLGIDGALLVGVQRHRTEVEAFELLDLVRPYRDGIVGIGLGGPEAANPPAKFARLFARARTEGLRLSAHAGEEGPASFVREAVELCGVDRIDHGNAGILDDGVRALLHDEGTALTLCPLSNLRLQVVESLDGHPLRLALDAGLIASVHSDDPACFGGYIADNYSVAQHALGLERDDLLTLVANSFRGSFAEADVIAASLREVEAYDRATADQA